MGNSLKKLKLYVFDQRAKGQISRYLLQSTYAALFIFAVFSVIYSVDQLLIITSLAATCFIVFTFPHAASASVRCVVGAYALAAVWGCFYSWVGDMLPFGAGSFLHSDVLACSLTVFVMTFMMAVLDMEHPPAAAMAASLVFMEVPYGAALISVLCVSVLSAVKWLLRKKLINL